jgi:hypothetical protein
VSLYGWREYVGVGNKVWRTGSEELCVNALVGGGGVVITYLPSPSNMGIEKGYDSPNKQCDKLPEDSEVVSIDREENKG